MNKYFWTSWTNKVGLSIAFVSLNNRSRNLFVFVWKWLKLNKSNCIILIVVTQFWIHQDFLKCYFISIISYKNPKKLRKRKSQKYIFLESTASFHKNRFHRVNTDQTMSTWVKNEFQAVFGSKPSFLVKTEFTGSIRVKPCRPG
jgi:hypothetical protein